MDYTDEQEVVITSKEQNKKVVAVAGAGKTTTLLGYAKARSSKSKLLLAYNSSVSSELNAKIKKNEISKTVASTTHSLAYQKVGKNYAKELQLQLTNEAIINALSLPIDEASKKSNLILSSQVKKLFTNYCLTAHDDIGDFLEEHEEFVSTELYNEIRKKKKSLIKYIERIWEKMDRGGFPATHDFYLKKFQLSKPSLPYDVILLDESQDTSPVVMDIFMHQKKAEKVLVGDKYQSIYAWRLAQDAMAKVDYPSFYLTKSFRFSQKTADLSSDVLELYSKLNPKFVLEYNIIGLGKDEDIGLCKSKAFLSRTNANILEKLIDYKDNQNFYIHLAGFKNEVSIKTFLTTEEGYNYWDILSIVNNKSQYVKNLDLQKFKNKAELEDFATLTNNTGLTQMISLAKRHKGSMKEFCETIDKKLVSSPEKADISVTTGHKSKGLEWDHVTVGDDFFDLTSINLEILKRDLKSVNWDVNKYLQMVGGNSMFDAKELHKRKFSLEKSRLLTDEQIFQEINLSYVAITRSKKNLRHSMIVK